MTRSYFGKMNSTLRSVVPLAMFLLWVPPFMTVDGLKMVHFGPKLAKLGRLVSIPKWPKRVQKGPKLSTQVFLFIWTAIY